MMNRIVIAALLLFVAILFVTSACGRQKTKNKITIATASNMQYAMAELSNAFTKETGIECDLVVGSSGKLTAQITEGAPYDIFVSADTKYPDQIFKNGMAEYPPKTYALGKLVLWTAKEELEPSLTLLTDESVTHIALANPKTAPYGVAAISILEHYELLSSVEDKLVYGESISQTNQFIISKSAELGFTAMSVVLSPEMKGRGNWTALNDDLYSPIEQAVVLIKRKKEKNKSAARFYDFLFSARAKQLLKNFGYSVNE